MRLPARLTKRRFSVATRSRINCVPYRWKPVVIFHVFSNRYLPTALCLKLHKLDFIRLQVDSGHVNVNQFSTAAERGRCFGNNTGHRRRCEGKKTIRF